MFAHGLERSWEKLNFFLKIVWLIWQNILLYSVILHVVLHLFFHKLFSGRKNHAFILLASYPLLLYEWIEKIETTQNIFLNPKSLAQTFKAIDWKKLIILIIILIQIRKFNVTIKKKQNSKIALEFQSLIQTKMKIWDLFSIFKNIENKWKDSFFKGNLEDATDQRSA